MDQRLLSRSVDVFAPIKALKLKTFSDQAKTKKKSAAGQDVILLTDKKLFPRLLKKIKIKKIKIILLPGNGFLSSSQYGWFTCQNKQISSQEFIRG